MKGKQHGMEGISRPELEHIADGRTESYE